MGGSIKKNNENQKMCPLEVIPVQAVVVVLQIVLKVLFSNHHKKFLYKIIFLKFQILEKMIKMNC